MASGTSGIIEKHSGETLNIGFRYHAPALGDDEYLTGAMITAQSGITAGTADITATEITVPISGGTVGIDYTIRFTASTSQGQTFIDDYLVKVIA